MVTEGQSRRQRAIAAYVEEVLGAPGQVQASEIAHRLPPFLREGYDFAQISLFGQDCLLLIHTGAEEQAPSVVDKQREAVAAKTTMPVVYVADQVSSYQRRGLIERKVPFLIPGTQLFLPFLAVDLRERFPRRKTARAKVRPATQATLLYWFYHGVDQASTPSAVASRLGYTKMSASRIFNDLETVFAELNTIRIESIGRERRVQCRMPMRELWEVAQPFLRSPVIKEQVVFRSWLEHESPPPLAGLSALAERTQLMAPPHPTFALTASEAKSRMGRERPRFHEHGEEAMTVQIWRYSPRLHEQRYDDQYVVRPITADPLSVYLSLKGSEGVDERVTSALEQLVRSAPWR